jgi:hypothetical protein
LGLQLEGSLADLHITAEADLQDFRRYDITQRETLRVTTRCLGTYDLAILNFDCNTPIEGGALRLTGGFTPQGTHDYDLSVALNRVPMAALATLARHAKRGLPDDLTASGEVSAAFGFHAHQGAALDWHGTGMTSNFLLESAFSHGCSGNSKRFSGLPGGRPKDASASQETRTYPAASITDR